jgi:replicative DNA helicase
MKETKQNIDLGGKVSPQAVEIEESVLGALMLEKGAIDRVTVKSEYFYKEANQKVFSAIYSLHNKSIEIDLLTVTEELRKTGILDEIGGVYYVSCLTNKVASAAHIETHIQIIFEKFVKRELIRISGEITQKAFDDCEDTFDLMDYYYSQLDKINNDISDSDELKPFGLLLKESISNLQLREKLSIEGRITGIQTPLSKLTTWTCGWQKKQLIVIAGRPSMGKTAWALGMIKTAAFYGIPSCLFSLEMSSNSLVDRILIGESGVNANDYRSGKINQYDWGKIDKTAAGLLELPILIDDSPKSINKIRAKVKTLHRKGKCEFLIIDYLQLSWDDGDKKNREQEIASITRKSKLLAAELNIPVVLLSQLNRGVESRQNKRPILSDLRESGAIEQDADLVGFIYRPEKYGITEDEETGKPLNGRCEFILEKQREGPLGTVYFRYNESVTAIYDWDEDYIPEKIDSNLAF